MTEPTLNAELAEAREVAKRIRDEYSCFDEGEDKKHQLDAATIDALIARVEKGEALLTDFVTAFDAKAIQMESSEVHSGEFAPPHPWHEEWLSRVRYALSTTSTPPLKENGT